MIKKIIITGTGGQGVRLLAHTLASILAELGRNVSVTYDFDTAVRGGKIIAYLVYSDEKIESPLIEEPDILLQLSGTGDRFVAEKIICDKKMHCEREECDGCKIPFTELANGKFGTPLVTNMIALGKLLDVIDVDLGKIDLKKHLPPRFVEKNIEAIKYGFSYREDARAGDNEAERG